MKKCYYLERVIDLTHVRYWFDTIWHTCSIILAKIFWTRIQNFWNWRKSESENVTPATSARHSLLVHTNLTYLVNFINKTGTNPNEQRPFPATDSSRKKVEDEDVGEKQ